MVSTIIQSTQFERYIESYNLKGSGHLSRVMGLFFMKYINNKNKKFIMGKSIEINNVDDFNKLFDEIMERKCNSKKSCTPKKRKRIKSDPKLWEKLNDKRINDTFFKLDDKTLDAIESLKDKEIIL